MKNPARVLFVCLGNICRSPAAEIVFRRLVEESGRGADFVIDSAGTAGYHEGSPLDSRMSECLQRKGYRIAGRARQIRPEDLDEFDLIVTMDEQNLVDVLKLDRGGSHRKKIRSFVEFCHNYDEARVPDPYYGGPRAFEHVIALLEDGCRGILAKYPAS